MHTVSGNNLKVLSSEMDLAEIRFIRNAFIKERDADVFRKIRAISYSCWLFGKKAKAHTTLSAAFYSLHTAVRNGTMNKSGICFHWRNEHFMPRMLFFSVGNSAMNAPLRLICNGAMNSSTKAALQREWGTSVQPL
jgi:hypothetical protein